MIRPSLLRLPQVALPAEPRTTPARRPAPGELAPSGLLVVVPTCRRPARVRANLVAVARLAASLRDGPTAVTRVRLLVLTSEARDVGAVEALLRREVRGRVPVTVRRVAGGHAAAATSSHDLVRERRGWDTAAKRNEGLLEALRRGCDRVLFLDDDVPVVATGWRESTAAPPRAVSTARVIGGLAAMAADPAVRAAGWRATAFPDNSVLRHAQRLLGDPVPVSIGGGALLVRVDPDVPCFPQSYNEDWLFLLSAGPQARVVCLGDVRQDAYYPFTAARAASEETGDVLADGVVLGRSLLRDREFWLEQLRERRFVLSETADRLHRARPEELDRLYVRAYPGLGLVAARGLRQDAEQAVRAALDVHHEHGDTRLAEELVSYEQTWLGDLDTWQRGNRATARFEHLTPYASLSP